MFEPGLGLGLEAPRGHFFVVLVLEKGLVYITSQKSRSQETMTQKPGAYNIFIAVAANFTKIS